MTSSTSSLPGWHWDNSYPRLPASLFSRVAPIAVDNPKLIIFNTHLAHDFGLSPNALNNPNGASIFAGNIIPRGAEPIAQAYAGHQFGHFTNLGDGRAILLGEHITPTGERVDIQLKGSGRTPYSRGGDGRAALGPMLREFIMSESMHALNIPTTRSLAVVTTGETVQREEPLTGAILTRTAASHIRVGTFEYAAAIGEPETLLALMQHTIRRHYPTIAESKSPALDLIQCVLERQAKLVAQWMGVGFIHGVMNTDNMTLSGETIDYGPCAFMDTYDPTTVFSSIDRYGRYAYNNQPQIAHWNLARLAESLLTLLADNNDDAIEIAETILATFPERYRHHWLAVFRSKLGITNNETSDDILINSLLDWMHKTSADFTNTFAALTIGEFSNAMQSADWFSQWQARLKRQTTNAEEISALMRSANPVIIPRNHHVEEALSSANTGNYSLMHRLLEALATPFEINSTTSPYLVPPPTSNLPYKTFCGT